ncbi:MAG: HAD family hydrolase [Armatimonadota bacterium]
MTTKNPKPIARKYKAILFDLDGTLVDSVPVIMRAFREVHEQMGLPFDEPSVRKLVGIPLREQAVLFAGERAEEFLDRYVPLYVAYQTADMRLFPGTVELLDELKQDGYRLGLVTSKSTRGAERVLLSTGVRNYFEVVVTADDVANHKPHPEPLLRALKLLGVGSREALFVGDSLFDVQAAREAGVDMAAVSWGALDKEELWPECPGRVFDTWQEFLDWLGAPR